MVYDLWTSKIVTARTGNSGKRFLVSLTRFRTGFCKRKRKEKASFHRTNEVGVRVTLSRELCIIPRNYVIQFYRFLHWNSRDYRVRNEMINDDIGKRVSIKIPSVIIFFFLKRLVTNFSNYLKQSNLLLRLVINTVIDLGISKFI